MRAEGIAVLSNLGYIGFRGVLLSKAEGPREISARNLVTDNVNQPNLLSHQGRFLPVDNLPVGRRNDSLKLHRESRPHVNAHDLSMPLSIVKMAR